jgi:hypothetical protein
MPLFLDFKGAHSAGPPLSSIGSAFALAVAPKFFYVNSAATLAPRSLSRALDSPRPQLLSTFLPFHAFTFLPYVLTSLRLCIFARTWESGDREPRRSCLPLLAPSSWPAALSYHFASFLASFFAYFAYRPNCRRSTLSRREPPHDICSPLPCTNVKVVAPDVQCCGIQAHPELRHQRIIATGSRVLPRCGVRIVLTRGRRLCAALSLNSMAD